MDGTERTLIAHRPHVTHTRRTGTRIDSGHNRQAAFADNLVPHVLRLDGVLRFDPDLVARIEVEEQLAPGSTEAVEIRVVGLHAVELLRAELARKGHDVPSWHLDMVLCRRGWQPAYKAHPRHCSRPPYY